MRWVTDGRRKQIKRITRYISVDVLLILLLVLTPFGDAAQAQAGCAVTGNVYRDYNNNGVRDAAEPGQPNIRVTLFDANNLIGATAQTDFGGNFTLNAPTVNGQGRVEFTNLSQFVRSGRFGGQSRTSVTFVDCAALAPVNFALFNPAEFCHTDQPDLATSCYVPDDQLFGVDANQPTVVSFGYGSQGDDPHQPLALARETGSTFGLAYQRTSDSFFAGAFLKRHAGFGPDATGANVTSGGIYRIDRIAGTTSLFLDLNTLPAPFQTGPSTHPTSLVICGPTGLNDCWQYDTPTYNLVGKASIGSMKMSEDDRTLYVMNLTTREVLVIPIGLPPVAPPAAAITRLPLTFATLPGMNNPATGCPNFADLRPFALEVKDGQLYVGMVCTAESTQDANDLRAFVYRMDTLAPGAFTPVLNFPLNYPRRCADQAPACNPARRAPWQPWSPTWPPGPLMGNGVVHPEPLLTDIEFDENDMVLGFRDRMGDRTGNLRPGPFDLTSVQLFIGIIAGDILRACANAAGGWTLENNGACGGVTTGGAGNTQGPGGGEYYFQDGNNFNGIRHDEISLGGLANLQGSDTIISTAFDPLCETCGFPNPLFDTGIIWLNNNTGLRTQSYRIFNGTIGGHDFGKTNGLGDLEFACGPAPLEIGNRVWIDTNVNGVQDPGEAPIPGVILQLYMDTDGDNVPDRLVARTVTNGNGEYYFNEANVFFNNPILGGPLPGINFSDFNLNGAREPIEPAGLIPNTAYEVRLDAPGNYNGGPLTDYFATRPNLNPLGDLYGDTRDSDGLTPAPNQRVGLNNIPVHRLQTGDFGDNNHTYDFGFYLNIPTPVVTIVGDSDLNLEKSVDNTFPQPGTLVTWRIWVTNPNNVAVSNIVVRDTMPPELEIISTQASLGTVVVNGQVVTWSIGTLGPSQSALLVIVTRLRSNVQPPYEIINEVTFGKTKASAKILSAQRLPDTGDTAVSHWRIPALLILGGLVVSLLAWLARRRIMA
jgi:uncharacterized repeat protein (TIGR01451 family)